MFNNKSQYGLENFKVSRKYLHKKNTGNFSVYIECIRPCFVPKKRHRKFNGPTKQKLTLYFPNAMKDGVCLLVGLKVVRMGCHVQPGTREAMRSIYLWIMDSGNRALARHFAEEVVDHAPEQPPANLTDKEIDKAVRYITSSYTYL